MIVSSNGVFGRVVPSQSKAGSITTDRGTSGAESSEFGFFASGLPSGYPKTAGLQTTWPEIECAYGSTSNLAGLKRRPADGLYGPCARYPYGVPGGALSTVALHAP